MVYTIQTFLDKFRSLVGDRQKEIPTSFVIDSLNWAFNSLPSVPKLAKAFSKHYTVQLDANDHFRWNLNGDFRCLADLPMVAFYTSSEGGDPCRLELCSREPSYFFQKNGLIELKQKGVPCEYTLEREGDNMWLTLDRPSDVPIIVDYIAYGYPMPVSELTNEIELSAIIENLVLQTMRDVFYQEAEDLSFAGAMLDQMSNKYIPEAIQMLNKRLGTQGNAILGEIGS